jgi:hypothetical protein
MIRQTSTAIDAIHPAKFVLKSALCAEQVTGPMGEKKESFAMKVNAKS